MDIISWEEKKKKMVERCGPWNSYEPDFNGREVVIRLKKDYQPLDAVFLSQVINTISNFLQKPWEDIRVLDLACMEGLSTIEIARQGVREVIGIEARPYEIARAQFMQEAMDLRNMTFYQDDVRAMSKEKYGTFDVVVCLGILYHLEPPALFSFMEHLCAMTTEFAVIDTHFMFRPKQTIEYKGKKYSGDYSPEHHPGRTPEERVLVGFERALDKEQSFWLTKSSLCNLLMHAGFTSVYQCLVPRGGGRQEYDDRMLLVAQKNPLRPLKSLNCPSSAALEHFPEKKYDLWTISASHPIDE